jgi:hypothetical protein
MLTLNYNTCCGFTLSSPFTVTSKTCVSSCIAGCSIADGQRRCGGGTTTVFGDVGIGVYGCYGTTNISLPLYTSYR